MNRSVLAIAGLIALAGVVGAVEFAGNEWKRAVLLTTADPDALGGVISTNMKPVEVTMHSRRPERTLVNGSPVKTGATIDARITFKVAAAYVSLLDLKDGPGGPQRIGFKVWDKSFDPAQIELHASLVQYRSIMEKRALAGEPMFAPLEPGGPVTDRMHKTGEDILEFEVDSISTHDPAEHERVLAYLAVSDPADPCLSVFDDALGMLVTSAPKGVRPSESCLETVGEGNQATFVKKRADGGIKFTVSCSGTGPWGQPLHDGRCQLFSYYRDWPMRIWVPRTRPETWDASFDRIVEFLNRITVATAG